MSVVFLYDGTFEGLMTAVYEGYYSDLKPAVIVDQACHVKSLFDQETMIHTDHIKANKVMEAVQQKLGDEVFQTIMYAFFSEDVNVGTIIYRFIKVAFKIGPSCLGYRAHDDIGPVLDLYLGVDREAHLLLGLIRFVELDSGILYSQFEGSSNVISILGSHFFGRLSGEQWVLHDIKRSSAVICDGESWVIREVQIPEDITLHEREELFQNLWKTYFKHIAIKERVNPKLQMQNMPKRYWKYLIEMQEGPMITKQDKTNSLGNGSLLN